MSAPGSKTTLTRGRIVIALVVIAMLGVAATSVITNLNRVGAQQVNKPADPAAMKTDSLEIISGEKRHRLTVELARNDAQRARGLMFRQSMAPDAGMLFDFERDQMISMWMRNTYLSLDMVFVLADGRIHRIEANTEPHSERTISSGAPVRAVLELNAGTGARLGLKPGDKLIHSMFR